MGSLEWQRADRPRTLAACLKSVVLAALGLALASGARAEDPSDLGELSLADLMKVEVTSASRKSEDLFRATAAIHVITQEDIRRSGARTIAEALRLAPGLDVAQINNHQWAVSSRGSNWPWANKLLVLVDGRSVYTPLFGGVHWDAQDLVLEDVLRIEVIRGPGATMWGANAVNGVINVITKKSSETQGTLVSAGLDADGDHVASVRHGGSLGSRTTFRVFGKHRSEEPSWDPKTGDAFDDWHVSRGGFRLDHGLRKGHFVLQVEGYDGSKGNLLQQVLLVPPYRQDVPFREDMAGQTLSASWDRRMARGGELSIHFSHDRTQRNAVGLHETRNTSDLDVQQRFAPRGRHELIWGVAARVSWDATSSVAGISLDPTDRTDRLFSAFIQDNIAFARDRVRLTLGSKIEHDDYTSAQVQPSVRFLYAPNERHAAWAAVSRALRRPSRAEADLRYDLDAFPDPTGFPTVVRVFGNPSMRSETLLACEVGYRMKPRADVTVDVTAFHNSYDHVRTAERGAPYLEMAPVPHAVLPLTIGNGLRGRAVGGELAVAWRPIRRWSLHGTYSFLDMHFVVDKSSNDTAAVGIEGESPRHQVQLRSLLNVSGRVELDASVQYTSSLPSQGVSDHLRLDLGVGWRPNDAVELRMSVHDALEPRHSEFSDEFGVFATEIERSVHAQVTWRF